MNIAEVAGWDNDKSIEIAMFQAKISSKMLFSGNNKTCIIDAIDEIYASDYTELDKKLMVLTLGIFMGKILTTKRIDIIDL